MNNEIISIEPSTSQQDSHTDTQQYIDLIFGNTNIQSTTNNIVNGAELDNSLDDGFSLNKSNYQSFTCICVFMVFTIIAMTASVIIVCLTTPKHTNQTCGFTFKRSAQRQNGYDSNPHHIAMGDFNQDGYLDIVVANPGIDNIGILLNYQNGTFAPQITYSTEVGSSPYSVAVGDVNNDTHLDIVVANYGTNSIGVLLGFGNGSFASPIITSLGSSHPLSLAIGYLNNHTILDIAIANYGTTYVEIFLQSC